MIPHFGFLVASVVLVAACAQSGGGSDYRVVSKDPKVTAAQIVVIVNRALEAPEGDGTRRSALASAWPTVDEKKGEVSFGLSALGGGRTQSIRNAEAQLLRDLRYAFGDRVEVFRDGERLRPDGTVEPRASTAAPPSAQEGVGLGP